MHTDGYCGSAFSSIEFDIDLYLVEAFIIFKLFRV